ncbi:MAG: hypothetical protein ABJB86_00045 [Bacteroidota bacterium]
MEKKITLLFYLCITFICRAQNDTNKIYNSNTLKKGFYKNYDEYINNAPSLSPDFSVVLFYVKNTSDTIITGAKYNINDGSDVSAGWGFCDGTNVFISKRISLFKKRFLKAQYIGKNPFLLCWHSDIYTIKSLPASPAEDAGATTKPARYDLMFINPEGKTKKASKKNLEKLFEEDPAILKKFRIERAYTDKIKTVYLIEFNEQFINEHSGNQ